MCAGDLLVAATRTEIPLLGGGDGIAVRVKEDGARAKQVALFRQIRPIHGESISESPTSAFDKHMPDVPGAVMFRVQLDDLRWLGIVWVLKQPQAHLSGIAAEQSEVCPTLLHVNP